eukprot:3204380-Prorocentrum_lima.AAC.1
MDADFLHLLTHQGQKGTTTFDATQQQEHVELFNLNDPFDQRTKRRTHANKNAPSQHGKDLWPLNPWTEPEYA